MKYTKFVPLLYVLCFVGTMKPLFGQNWSQVLTNRTIKSIVTLKDSTLLSASSNALLISVNDGKQWAEVSHNFGADLIRVKRKSESNFAVLTWGNQGIWISSDGQTFSPYNSGLTDRFVLDMDFKDTVPFIVGTTNGLYLNSNGSFIKVTSILNGSWTQSTLVINDSTYIAGGVDKGVFRTTNRGQTWTQIQGLPVNAGQSIARAPNGDIYLGCWGGGLFVSKNNGTSFTKDDQNMPSGYILDIQFSRDGDVLVAAYLGVAFRKSNSTQWTNISTAIASGAFESVAFSSKGYGLTGKGETNGMFRTVEPLLQSTTPSSSNWVTYTSFQSATLTRYVWEGENIAVLTKDSTHATTTMNQLVSKLDQAYAFFATVSGRTPQQVAGSLYNGKLIIAQVPATCGAGCGYLGATGIEILDEYMLALISQIQQNQLYDQIPFFELGRNFWFYSEKINYKPSDNEATVVTGFAVLMRYLSMQSAGVQGAPFLGVSFETFEQQWRQLRITYESSNEYNWNNTLRIGSAPSNSLNLGSTDLMASLLLYVIETYGTNATAFMQTFLTEVTASTAAATTQQAVDNLIFAASVAANQSLVNLFEQTWKFPVSSNVKARIQARFSNTPPQVIGSLAPIKMVVSGSRVELHMRELFSAVDFQNVTFQVTNSNPGVVSISQDFSGSSTIIYLNPFTPGETIISLKAVDAASESDNVFVQVTVMPAEFFSISMNSSDSYFTTGLFPKMWNLTSIPGMEYSATPKELFDSKTNSDFRIYTLNTAGEYVNQTNVTGPIFSPTDAFWFKTMGTDEAIITETFQGKRVRERSRDVSVSNWKMISNPYEEKVYWKITDAYVKLFKYYPQTETWDSVRVNEQLLPWGGYIAYSPAATRITLYLDKIIPIASSKAVEGNQTLVQNTTSISDEVEIHVNGEKLRMITNSLASNEFDRYDMPLLPSVPDKQKERAYFKNATVPLVTDVRPLAPSENYATENHRKLVLPKDACWITWNSTNAEKNHSLILYNEDNFYRVLAANDTLVLASTHKNRELTVLWGEVESLKNMGNFTPVTTLHAFPNPFNPTTNFQYSLSESGNVRVVVYDLNGRVVADFAEGFKQSGLYRVPLNGNALSSGIYLANLIVNGNAVTSIKITLLK